MGKSTRAVNWLLMIVTVALALGFRRSDNLAAAYGIAVSLTMLMTSVLLFIAMREVWRWNLIAAGAAAAGFLLVDGAFFAANVSKILEGGYVPLLLALARLWSDASLAPRRYVGARPDRDVANADRSIYCGAAVTQYRAGTRHGRIPHSLKTRCSARHGLARSTKSFVAQFRGDPHADRSFPRLELNAKNG